MPRELDDQIELLSVILDFCSVIALEGTEDCVTLNAKLQLELTLPRLSTVPFNVVHIKKITLATNPSQH